MKNFPSILLNLIIVGFFLFRLQAVRAGEVDWEAFSKNVVKALKSDNTGLQQSAMQMVIKYSSQLNVKDAVFDVMRIYRNDKNQQVRRLALVTLTNMDSEWAKGFLKREIQFEGDSEIKKQLIAINTEAFLEKPEEEDLTSAYEDFNKLKEEVLELSEEEALFPYKKDADGESLDANTCRYMLRFTKDQLPPVQAFWSVAIYDSATQLLVNNPLNRYPIKSPVLSDLKMDTDGGLTLYVQYTSPGENKETNWLPAPNGPFYILLRLYWPRQEVLNGNWSPPALQKIK